MDKLAEARNVTPDPLVVAPARIVPVLLLAAVFTYACGPRPPVGETQARKPSAGARALASSLNVSVANDVDLNFLLINGEAKKVEVSFPSGLTHDFVVLDSLDREVWRWSTGRVFTQAMQNHVLEQNESLAYRATWEPGERRGSYVAVVSLNSGTHPIEQRMPFTLP